MKLGHIKTPAVIFAMGSFGSAHAATILQVDYTAGPAAFTYHFSGTPITIGGGSIDPQYSFFDGTSTTFSGQIKGHLVLGANNGAEISQSPSATVVFGIAPLLGATEAETLGAPGYYGLEFNLADGSAQDGYALVDRNGYHISEIGYRPAGTSDVPEPESWALMILGLGGAGTALRRRRAARTLAIA